MPSNEDLDATVHVKRTGVSFSSPATPPLPTGHSRPGTKTGVQVPPLPIGPGSSASLGGRPSVSAPSVPPKSGGSDVAHKQAGISDPNLARSSHATKAHHAAASTSSPYHHASAAAPASSGFSMKFPALFGGGGDKNLKAIEAAQLEKEKAQQAAHEEADRMATEAPTAKAKAFSYATSSGAVMSAPKAAGASPPPPPPPASSKPTAPPASSGGAAASAAPPPPAASSEPKAPPASSGGAASPAKGGHTPDNDPFLTHKASAPRASTEPSQQPRPSAQPPHQKPPGSAQHDVKADPFSTAGRQQHDVRADDFSTHSQAAHHKASSSASAPPKAASHAQLEHTTSQRERRNARRQGHEEELERAPLAPHEQATEGAALPAQYGSFGSKPALDRDYKKRQFKPFSQGEFRTYTGDVFAPPLLFFMVALVFAFWWELPPVPVLVTLFGLAASLRAAAPAHADDHTTVCDHLPMFLVKFAVITGVITGLYAYEAYTSFYYIASHGADYRNVLASSPAAEYADAGTIEFATTSKVDTSKALGYQDRRRYCVAPVLDEGSAQSVAVSFWAVGIDCCGHRADFECGDVDGGSRGGVRLPPDGIFSAPSSDFLQAINQTSLVFGLKVVADPILVHWVADSSQRPTDMLFRAIGACFLGAVLFSLFELTAYVIRALVRDEVKVARG